MYCEKHGYIYARKQLFKVVNENNQERLEKRYICPECYEDNKEIVYDSVKPKQTINEQTN